MNNPPTRYAQVEDILKRLSFYTFVILLSVVGVIQYHRDRRRRRRGIFFRHRQVTAVPEMIVRRGRRRGSSRRQRWTRDDPPRRHRRIRGTGIVLFVRVIAYDEPAVAVAQLHYVLKHRRCEKNGLTLSSVVQRENTYVLLYKDRINDSNYVLLNFVNDLNLRSIRINNNESCDNYLYNHLANFLFFFFTQNN